MLKKLFVCVGLLGLIVVRLFAQDLVNDVDAALAFLEKRKSELRTALETPKSNAEQAELLGDMLDVGLWEEVWAYLNGENTLDNVARHALRAQYWWLNNEFSKAEQELSVLKGEELQRPEAVVQRAQLLVEAWRLEEAEQLCKEMLRVYPGHEKISTVLGRSLLLQKKYEEALALAKAMQQANPSSYNAYLLEGDVYFWDQRPELAEPAILKCLTLNPLEANARFSYGYAIWRRFDATLLNDMAGQWEVALAINPLHFQTHWHWGNGHTNLTFADYVDEQEDEIREQLVKADDLVRQNAVDDALQVTVDVAKKYQQSVLPQMHQASIYYSDFDHPERHDRLNEAQELFLQILERKPHYGPAHNGLAAVIKSKRIPYLSSYDSISTRLKNLEIHDWKNFSRVFPDVTYYPGEMAKAMAWNQLYTAVVYFPFLTKQQNAFVIPPLHIDLAIAMKAPYFRFNTTFDNRQWMDIRGVGSGAADIGYVERGAYQERNVLLHEYVHLFHGRVLTDQQNRRIRALYYSAMDKGLTLDYYSQNNESEYFAQTYPAYFERVKVHPLDFKSMNTLHDLKTKDPDMYAFLDELVKNESAYLAGDTTTLASNWAQVFVNLSNRSQRVDMELARRYLDTALIHDSNYLPALIAYSRLELAGNQVDAAVAYVDKVIALDNGYAPAYTVRAEIVEKQKGNTDESIREQATFYTQAFEKEDDFQLKAQNAVLLREFYHRNGLIADAIRVADLYGASGSEISTYLRDRKDDAKAYAAATRSLFGNDQHLGELKTLVAKRPQNYNLRGMYADALIANRKYADAVTTLLQVQRILEASASGRPDFELRIAEAYAKQPEKADSLNSYLEKLLVRGDDPSRLDGLNNQRLVRLLVANTRIDEAAALFANIPDENSRFYQSSRALSEAMLARAQGMPDRAVALLEKAIGDNAYQLEAYEQLLEFYEGQHDQTNRINGIVSALKQDIAKR